MELNVNGTFINWVRKIKPN